MSTEARDLTTAIDFGFEVEAFLQSRLGKHLIQRAETEIDDNVEALKKADPEDAKAIRTLQNAIYRAEAIQYWMAEAIQAGEMAQQQFIDQST